MPSHILVGMDVGSTTVKAVAVDPATDQMIWSDYQRHETKQPEKTLEFLGRLEADLGISPENCRMFITGSGGGNLAALVGAKFVQEVTAVSLAVEKLHPEVHSVIYLGVKLHKVAGKCGVFAETDINGLQKEGTPSDELMASLFDAIVLQNLTVLTRGHTLRPHVLLLGGPNTFIRGMREAWQANIPRMWQERKVEVPAGAKPEDLIKAPQNAQYFAARGSVGIGGVQR